MADQRVRPIPPQLRDQVESDLHDVADGSLRWKVRRMVEHAYAAGYAEGHLNGSQEERSDARAARDAERAAAGG